MSGHRRPARLALLALLAVGLFCGIVAVVAAARPGVPASDRRVAVELHAFVLAHDGLARALRVLADVSQPTWLRIVAAVAGLLLLRAGRRREGGWLLLAFTVAGVLGTALKVVLARPRPSWTQPLDGATGYSLPSGHAVTSVVATGCLLTLVGPALTVTGRRVLSTAAAAFVLAVGFDRTALGVHYLSDVVAGWLVGIAVLAGTAAVLDPRPDGCGPAAADPDDG